MGIIAIPTFTGATNELQPWIEWMEQYFARDGDFTEFQKLHMAWGFIYGDADIILHEIEENSQYFETWDALKTTMLSRFGAAKGQEPTPQLQEADSKETVTVASVSTTTESELEIFVSLLVSNVPEETPESKKIGEDNHASVVMKSTPELPEIQKETPLSLQAHQVFVEMSGRRNKQSQKQILSTRKRKRMKRLVGFKKIKVKIKWKTLGISASMQSESFDTLSHVAFSLLVEAYGKAGEADKAKSSFDEMRNLGHKPDDKCIANMVGAYKSDKSLDKALRLLLQLEKDGVEIDVITYTVLVDWMANLGLIEEAEQLLVKISPLGETPPIELQLSLCCMYASVRNEKRTLQTLGVLEAKRDQMGHNEFEKDIPASSGSLKKEIVMLFLEWIKCSRQYLPYYFLESAKRGSILQNGYLLVDIPLVDRTFYGKNMEKYKEELKTAGVMFKFSKACKFVGDHLMSLAASSTLTCANVFSILKFIRSPDGAVLFSLEWKAAGLREREVIDVAEEGSIDSDQVQSRSISLPKRKGKFKYKIYGLELSDPKWSKMADKIHEAEEGADGREPKPVTGKCKLIMEKLESVQEGDDPSILLAEWIELLEPNCVYWEQNVKRHSLVVKKVSIAGCTHDSMKVLQKVMQKRSRHVISPGLVSRGLPYVNACPTSVCYKKQNTSSFTLPFTAQSPTPLLSLHLQRIKELDHDSAEFLGTNHSMGTSRGCVRVDCITEHSEPSRKSNGQTDGPSITSLKEQEAQDLHTPPQRHQLGSDSKNKGFLQKGRPNKRIRRSAADVSRGLQKDLESSCGDANVLVTLGDRSWREFGAQVFLEPFDNNEWKLAVKISGTTKYSHRAHQFLQPGSTNRVTHAMILSKKKQFCNLETEMNDMEKQKKMGTSLVGERNALVDKLQELESINVKENEKLEKLFEESLMGIGNLVEELETVVRELLDESSEALTGMAKDLSDFKSSVSATKSARLFVKDIWPEIIMKDCALSVLHLCHLGVLLETVAGINTENGLLQRGLCASNSSLARLRENNLRLRNELEMCTNLKGKLVADIKNGFERISRNEEATNLLATTLSNFEQKISGLQNQEELMLQRYNSMGSQFDILLKEIDLSNVNLAETLFEQELHLNQKADIFDTEVQHYLMDLCSKDLESLVLALTLKEYSSCIAVVNRELLDHQAFVGNIKENLFVSQVESELKNLCVDDNKLEIDALKQKLNEAQSKIKNLSSVLDHRVQKIAEMDAVNKGFVERFFFLESNVTGLQQDLAKKASEISSLEHYQSVIAESRKIYADQREEEVKLLEGSIEIQQGKTKLLKDWMFKFKFMLFLKLGTIEKKYNGNKLLTLELGGKLFFKGGVLLGPLRIL